MQMIVAMSYLKNVILLSFYFDICQKKPVNTFYPLYPDTVLIHIFRINDPAIPETAIYLLCML